MPDRCTTSPKPTPPGAPRWQRAVVGALFAAVLAGCGGGGGGGGGGSAPAPAPGSPTPPPPPSSPPPPPPAPAPATMSQRDAVRLADQASFGPTESLVTAIRAQGASAWVAAQMQLNTSRYTSGGGGEVHQYTGAGEFCNGRGTNCWRDWYSTEPLLSDFYRNALGQQDQLRQRVAYALQQIVVVNNLDVSGTYGFRNYHNVLIREAFGNYRQVLKKVSLSPVMGDFLNNANNDKDAPNENFARELLQLFSIGTCELNADGTLRNGACTPTYTNEQVRAYAYALTGWTYPSGGATSYGCYPTGANCRYYGGANDGDMVPVARYHDTAARTLLNGYSLAAGHTAAQALETVLDSVMTHPNTAPFIGKQLIQHLVSSNPSPAYVGRVANAFVTGRYGSFGGGQRGDLAATVAAVLLDAEARGDSPGRSAGRLREPVLMFTGVLRGLAGTTDGDALSWWWGQQLRQHMFRAPSVFNFYPPDYPVAGTSLVGPAFGIHNASTALARLNYLTYLLDWGGTPAANSGAANPLGTLVNLSAYTADATDAGVLVDRLSNLALGRTLTGTARSEVVRATEWWTSSRDPANWRVNRVKTAAFLIYGSPHYHVQR
ncbi:DUF1800 family protein [Piscinibacter sp. HJYY11]|uniref:DUF1800 domain-containing protein n=1 Tax=Piscinibacter sp. HJYY11 TaxID=2801333 RepID=UPI00191E295F|nr:DUF1800 family protein [Piscinibacter sp. HJYY11]MBL0729342.1 DUF1800 domain-containing protein [Piscinibacter sp. HJYY11]